ncbi:MAG TPA: hypothetical protein VKE51_06600 [Vicinamibacterales bacterium]|nr:hypothetical protein [Vicinamibacterales bacterium]
MRPNEASYKAIGAAVVAHRRCVLKLTKLPRGLILNFGVAHMRHGITRIANAPDSEL